MIKSIAKYIKDKPYLAQVAKDGLWEKAFTINLIDPDFEEEKFQLYLEKNPFKNLDIELFFKNGDEIYILGISFNNNLYVSSVSDFIIILIQYGKKFRGFENLISNLDSKLVGESYLLQGEPDLIRIGIVNHWFSVGPILLWQKGWKKEINHDILQERFSTKPEVSKTNLNYQGMSFIFNLNNSTPGVRHWIKSPCSKKIENEWVLENGKIIHYLKDWTNFKEI
ncbi:hypothetical protein A2866_02950 [Candidatus Roizmanbacteria bacterium RIFCSPHIGHO2_01_FULL_39_8]|uniref:Uncharacterized protein n=3 Tax=Candidatus Roizmaniibacteriota TaxID=1752723 RepID=A0A1F7GGM7_9BACT|nr:MAG: hypothetical protein A2866_02950 [Candidatus Roizmanbacteria bacterium RIFCSPHIGHO2_01_FULL_39_8]OGK27554.1 MAG: hypothetical protein A3C28_05985 [Candidatus Roizmanbacteria bacterium RIFCSPHIGHO2_02_FULL_39_9]OGK37494.1 MAG: hypothetical protein A3F60_02675 [Candidatus Roizmanbacteria bacterium RIFCSPHIGHO2_12_FULL_39_8]